MRCQAVSAIHSSMKSAVILLSGGLDSATVLAMARSDGFTCHTLSLDYGQRHRSELDAAAETMGANDIFSAPTRWTTRAIRIAGPTRCSLKFWL